MQQGLESALDDDLAAQLYETGGGQRGDWPTSGNGKKMMLGLRLVQEGVTRRRFHDRFGCNLKEVFGEKIRELAANCLNVRPIVYV